MTAIAQPEQLALDILPPPEGRKYPTGVVARAALVEGTYRFWLRRRWATGPEILWCMLNPSIADHRIDDPTMKRVVGFSYRWGFAACVVVNLFPFRSPDPAALAAWRRAAHWDASASCLAFSRNIDEVVSAIEATTMHVAAWGAFEPKKGDRRSVLEAVAERLALPIEWRCLGLSREGAPMHPLARGKNRIPDHSAAVPFVDASNKWRVY